MTDVGLDVAGDDGEAAAAIADRLEGLPGQVALDRPHPGEPTDGRSERFEGRAELGRDGDIEREPGGRIEMGLGAGVAHARHEGDDRLHLGLGGRIASRRDRPVGDDEQIRVIAIVGQGRPDRLGHEWHHRVEEAEVRIERLDEGPPGGLAIGRLESRIGQADLGELDGPVAVLVPDRLVEGPGDLGEGEVGHAPVDGARPSPPPVSGASGRPARGGSDPASRRAVPAGIDSGRAPTT